MENEMTTLELQQIKLNEIVEGDFGRVAVILEGRDTAGKTGTIRELTHYLPTSKYSVSLSNKPNKWEMKHWLKSWKKKLPAKNQIVFYDRSWYSRALVQKLNGWCTDKQYEQFMLEVNKWESSQDVKFIKFWLSISENEQKLRIDKRKNSPLTKWKFSQNDARALSYFDEMSILKERVMSSTSYWNTIDYNASKPEGRLALITRLVTILGEAQEIS
jgi:polyphosphate kinase 2 (PPK2 family)